MFMFVFLLLFPLIFVYFCNNFLMKKIVLISCASKKCPNRAKAKDLYVSTLFRSSMTYANTLKADKIYILSALHHVLELDEVIEPYNVTLSNVPKNKRDKTLKVLNKQEKIKWGEEVFRFLEKVTDINKTHFIFLAGKEYIEPLKEKIPHFESPLSGMRQGERVKFLQTNS